MSELMTKVKTNLLDFPMTPELVVDFNKTCPRCHSHKKTVLRRAVERPDGGEVECYGCRIAFEWRKHE